MATCETHHHACNCGEAIILAAKMLVEKFDDYWTCELEHIDDEINMLKEALEVGDYIKKCQS